jgi:hypothetical protein
MLAGPCLARTGRRRGLSYQAGAPDRAILTGRPDRLDGAVDRAEVDRASRQFFIENQAGAGGNISMSNAGRAVPDG